MNNKLTEENTSTHAQHYIGLSSARRGKWNWRDIVLELE
jgi:hypothetical protein